MSNHDRIPSPHRAVVWLFATLAGVAFSANTIAAKVPWQRVLLNAPGAEPSTDHGEFVDMTLANGTRIVGVHAGVDISVCGTSIVPLTQGTIRDIGWNTFFGNYVIVEDTDGLFSFFAHLENASVPPNTRIGTPIVRDANGILEVIGRAGNTGSASTGCHLHFERRLFSGVFLPDIEVDDKNCRKNVYPLASADDREDECFLKNWDDPAVPLIGEFDARSPRPPGYQEEAATAGIDGGAVNWTKKFRDAYNEANFASPDAQWEGWLGRPQSNHGGGNRVHLWARHGVNRLSQGVLIHDLKAPPEPLGYQHGHSALIANTRLRKVFLIRTGFWNVYVNHGGPWNLGAPTSNEEKVSGFVLNGNVWNDEGSVQHFERGTLFFAPFLDHWYPTVDGVALLRDGQVVAVQEQVSLMLSSAYAGYPWGLFHLLIGGNPYCQTPCVDRALFSDFVYELQTPVGLAGVVLFPSAGFGVAKQHDAALASEETSPEVTLSADGTTFAFPVGDAPMDVLLTPGLVNTTLQLPDDDGNGVGDLAITYPNELVLRYDYFDPQARVDYFQDVYADEIRVTNVTAVNLQGWGWNDGDLTEPLSLGHPFPGSTSGAMTAFMQIPATSVCSGLRINGGVESFEGEWPAPGIVLQEGRQLCVAVLPEVTAPDGSGDYDGDGLEDYFEACELGTNPCLVDSDGDGLSDGDAYQISLIRMFNSGFELPQ